MRPVNKALPCFDTAWLIAPNENIDTGEDEKNYRGVSKKACFHAEMIARLFPSNNASLDRLGGFHRLKARNRRNRHCFAPEYVAHSHTRGLQGSQFPTAP